ncbi:MAG: hypothetical protein AAF657_26445 [Acidobacteriota bacterium]
MRQSFFAIVFLLLPTFASAAELSLMAGVRSGQLDWFVFETVDTEVASLAVEIPFKSRLAFEVLLNHQSGSTRVQPAELPLFDPSPQFRQPDYEQSLLQLSLLHRWPMRRTEPFLGAGLGMVRFETDEGVIGGDSITHERAAFNVVAGAKFFRQKQWGLRVEGRAYWADLPQSFFDDDLFQVELSSGVTFKW